MRMKFLLKSLTALAVTALFFTLPLGAVTVWTGVIPAGTVADDINIAGNCQFNGHVIVDATAASRTINITAGGPVALSPDPAVLTPNLCGLHFTIGASNTITLNFSQNVTFEGVLNTATATPDNFAVTVTAAGTGATTGQLVFNGTDLMTTDFSNGGVTGAGAHLLINTAGHTATGPADTLVLVKRNSIASNNDVSFVVGNDSTVTFIGAAASTNSAGIMLDATNANANTGRLKLGVLDRGGFLVQAQVNNNATINTTSYGDIDWTTLVGTALEIQTKTPTAGASFAGLLVYNQNRTYTQLRANPWRVVGPTYVRDNGFIVGQKGNIRIQTGSYLQYFVDGPNLTPSPLPVVNPLYVNNRPISTIIKDRNPSALIIDGDADVDVYSTDHANIIYEGTGALYFASSVRSDGTSYIDHVTDLVPPVNQYSGAHGAGTIMFSVEAPLSLQGTALNQSAIEILSLEVDPTGDDVLSTGAAGNFPKRTFDTDVNGDYNQYGVGCFMINNMAISVNTNLKHTDEIHQVYRGNDPYQSAPCYIGGETWWLINPAEPVPTQTQHPRPRFMLVNSTVHFHSNMASTGVDWNMPECQLPTPGANNSFVITYGNGLQLDQGTGRTLIFGTEVGATASDYNTIINADSHIDVMQLFPIAGTPVQLLTLQTALNSSSITEGLTSPSGTSVHQWFLGSKSNFSIGSNVDAVTDGINPDTGAAFTLTTEPTVYVSGDYYSFESAGGTIHDIASSATTGEGGIFVDLQGAFELNPANRANFKVMVAQSRNGIVNLPVRNAFFNDMVGKANTYIDLSAATGNTEIIAAGAYLSDYTFDWANVNKDYTGLYGGTTQYVPYEFGTVPAAGNLTAVTDANLVGLPQINGTVDQFQVLNSRLGDQPGFRIGGFVREFLMFPAADQAITPTAFLVVEDGGFLGLGSASRTTDSDFGYIKLGTSGVTLVPNGTCKVLLNQDLIVEKQGVAAILPGPDFGASEEQYCYIYSDVPREIRIREGGIFDLSALTSTNQQVLFGGNVRLVAEPGAIILLGQGVNHFTDTSIFRCEHSQVDTSTFTSLTQLDPYRVQICATGLDEDAYATLKFSEKARLELPRNSFLSVESAGERVVSNAGPVSTDDVVIMDADYTTRVEFLFNDNAGMAMGDSADYGGAFQVGNTTDETTEEVTPEVSFRLNLDGPDTFVQLGSQSFFGTGVGMVSKPDTNTSAWTVNDLFNLGTITFRINGELRHAEIFPTSDKYATLLAIGAGKIPVEEAAYIFTNPTTLTNISMLGGGNVILSTPTVATAAYAPVVLTTAGTISARYAAGIMASTDVILDPSMTSLYATPTTAAGFFGQITANNYTSQITTRAEVTRAFDNTIKTVFILDDVIKRENNRRIRGLNTVADPEKSLELGDVGVIWDTVHEAASYYSLVA
ncbi:MAG: hypothetical protein UU47_C0002G0032 [candidate division TM6 bacterium GW2011_GWE2_41_16]|nr:MAG: hypothetical protein UU47_C0002G0032 [candidate division TM6 bacterium GW2011_GWE2_41_16]